MFRFRYCVIRLYWPSALWSKLTSEIVLLTSGTAAASEAQQRLGVLPEQFPLDLRRVVGVFGEVRQPLVGLYHRVVGAEHHLVLQDGAGVLQHLVVDVARQPPREVHVDVALLLAD